MGLMVPSKPLAKVFFAASNGAVNAERCMNFLRFINLFGPSISPKWGGNGED
jgi:hypothetical protein